MCRTAPGWCASTVRPHATLCGEPLDDHQELVGFIGDAARWESHAVVIACDLMED